MANNDDELKYKNVINTLKSLQKVKAPSGFEADLMRRINNEKFEEKQSFWEKIFLPSRLIPSAALAVSAVILLFVININSDETENPLLMEPKVREDVIQTENISDLRASEEKQTRDERNDASEDINLKEFRSDSAGAGREVRNQNYSYTSVGYPIDKNGLNFRQMNLSEEEKQILNELKEHFRNLLKNSRNN
jgi:hypothetical protein